MKNVTKISRTVIVAMVVGLLMAGAYGCKKEGPMEKTGKEIDKAAEKTGDKIEQTGDKIKESVK